MQFDGLTRREFITLIGSVAGAWPFAAHAQQPNSIRRIGLLMMYPEGDPQGELRAGVFQREIEKIGWKVGGNLKINFHWARATQTGYGLRSYRY
jgi:putative ABC transport system substrate-binding protein